MQRLLVALFAILAACSCCAAEVPSGNARVTGIVVDVDGNPVAGAEVRNWRRKVKPVLTYANGRFTIELDGISIRYTRLIAACDQDKRLTFFETEDKSGDFTQTLVDVRLVLKPSRDVSVKVVDASGKPVPHAAVSARQASVAIAFTDCDAQGHATLRVPEDAKITDIVAVKAGVGLDYYENKASSAWLDVKPLPAEITLTLDGASKFQIRALDSKGKPIPDLEFCPWFLQIADKRDMLNLSGVHTKFPTIRATDADGLATFDFLPLRLQRKVPFLCLTEEWTMQLLPNWPPPEISATDGLPVLPVTLLRCVCASGLVLHANGTPAADIPLQAQGHGKVDNSCRRFARTGADGTFSFLLEPEQSYLIAVVDKDWAAPSMSGLVLHEGDDRPDIFFTLGRGTLVSGTLTNLATREPVPGKTLTVVQKGEPIIPNAIQGPGSVRSEECLERWIITDGQGRYSIRLGPGRYEISSKSNGVDPTQITVGEQPEMQLDLTY